MELNQLVNMGGYGVYVWTAYGMTVVVFGINLFAIYRKNCWIKTKMKHMLAQASSDEQAA